MGLEVRAAVTGMANAGKGTLVPKLAEFGGRIAGLTSPIPIVGASAQLRRPFPELVEVMGIAEEDARLVPELMANGLMVPARIIHAAMGEKLRRPEFATNWCTDGFPRIIEDVDFLEGLSKSPTVVLVLVAKKDELRRRAADRFVDDGGNVFSCHLHKLDRNGPRHPVTKAPLKKRNDDLPEAVEKRFVEYDATVALTVERYKAVARPGLKVIEIDTTMLDPGAVFTAAINRIFG